MPDLAVMAFAWQDALFFEACVRACLPGDLTVPERQAALLVSQSRSAQYASRVRVTSELLSERML